jgi:ribonuclease P protein component
LRSSADFATVTRFGRRVRSGDLVVYFAGADHGSGSASRPVSDQTSSGPARAGLVVSRQVGGSVVRHQVSRRLRAQLAGRIPTLPAGSRLVVRALPSAAQASSQALGRQLDTAFGKLTGPKPAKAVR